MEIFDPPFSSIILPISLISPIYSKEIYASYPSSGERPVLGPIFEEGGRSKERGIF